MRPITVDQQAGSIVVIISISAYMVTAIDNQHLLSVAASHPLSGYCTGKTGSNHQIIKHGWILRLESRYAAQVAQPSVSTSFFLRLTCSCRSMSFPTTISTETCRLTREIRCLM